MLEVECELGNREGGVVTALELLLMLKLELLAKVPLLPETILEVLFVALETLELDN